MRQFIEELENLVRSNQHVLVETRLNRLSISEITEEYRLPLAKIANRVKHPLFTLKLLRFVRFEDGPARFEKTDDTIIEYSYALDQLGCVEEAQGLLETVSNNPPPIFYRTRAFSHIYNWNYAAAIPLLEKYLQLIPPRSYDAIVGLLNLAASQVNERHFESARDSIEKCQKQLKQMKQHQSVLSGNLKEIEALLYFYEGNLTTARKLFEESLQSLRKGNSVYSLFVDKWLSIIELKRQPKDERAKEKISRLREKVKKWGHWESMRELDLYQGLILEDENLIARVLLGTSKPHYRERVKKMIPPNLKLPDAYIWRKSSKKAENELHLQRICLNGNLIEDLQKAPKLLALTHVLCSDLYRPLFQGAIFYPVFPDQFFDPYHSQDRIYQLISRLRKVLDKNKIDLIIHNTGGSYHASPGDSLQIVLEKQRLPLQSKYDILFLELHQKIGGQIFTAAQVGSLLKCDRNKAVRLLRHGRKQGKIETIFKGSKTCYRIVA